MRIVVSSPPKAGNHWIKCLLGQIYDLRWLPGQEKPTITAAEFRAWVAAGGFPDGTIYHQHCKFTPAMASAIAEAPASSVTIVRDPYDAFVSLYYWVQERLERGQIGKRARPRDAVAGKPLDHPDVLAFIAEEYGSHIGRALGWLRSGRAIPVRYEELHADPVGALTRVTNAIAPVPPSRIAAAIEACTAENMRQMHDKFAWHIRSAKVGDSRQRLTEAHLAVFRERHGALIRALGYEVR